MSAVIALVGRPNVGKSTLFNRLTGSRDALVADHPGLTRDRQYGVVRHRGSHAVVVDTGGMGEELEGVGGCMHEQARTAIAGADAVVFLVDGRAGSTVGDEEIAAELRRAQVPVFLAVNKTDGLEAGVAAADFHGLGLQPVHSIAATRGRGVGELLDAVFAALPPAEPEEGEVAAGHGIPVALIGRPNVGKSTLVNRLLGEERVVVYDEPGTTRDSIAVPFERDGQHYTLIDTAGVRRRARVQETVEKFSVVKTLEAIERASVVVLVTDAQEGITEQDAHLAGHVLQAGRALVLVINKWDGLDPDQRRKVRRDLDLRFGFLGFARHHFVSALHGSGVGLLLESVDRAHAAAHRDLATPELNEALQEALANHQPPLSRGRRIKLRYAHQGGHNPPVIVVHGNQVQRLPRAYMRYLENFFRDAFDLYGTPVRIECRASENPFADKPNQLTERQRRRRQRVIHHAKKREKKRKRRR
ncbi:MULTISPECIES: ribosome biogenesis GTPase Der [Halorhodospira]|uniref:ribosome biogenesis GTPase Der n=1 Tax=Halorhodospira TaxID=85108 RepID=UPI001913674E|nr:MULTISPECIES: ribosome biogenesis GTPase Der [Halorhodospira]MBK5942912.1 ribosome biogenesis GTPase Der [Halorhodospira halophila]MCG5537304.1 ribosome biogenesis GTPase Der [Halorhodospira sp. 9622]